MVMLVASSAFASDSYTESGFCSPGLPCYENSNHKTSLEQLAELANAPALESLEERRVASNSEAIRTNQIFYSDDREIKSRAKGSELSPIGVVQFANFMATGTLISKCHVLTNVHAIANNHTKISASQQVKFSVGQARPKGFEKSVAGHPVKWGPYVQSDRNIADDWMVIELNECVGNEFGWMEIEPTSTAEVQFKPNAVQFAGHTPSTYLGVGVALDPKCTIQDSYQGIWFHDCSEEGGSSGGPILKRGSDGKLRMIGMHSSTFSDSPERPQEWTVEKSNMASHVNYFYSKISEFLE